MKNFIHKTVIKDKNVRVGSNSKVWHWSHLSDNVSIGANCVLGQNVFIGKNVKISSNVKIQNNVSVYEGVILKKNVFCGPSVVFTNVKFPRSKIKAKKYIKTIVEEGATIGANSTIICGIKLGKNSLIGAGSVVTKNVPQNSIVFGNPAKKVGSINNDGKKYKILNEKKKLY
tara:strand:- start:1312 stop:1827 length:516 start_codon:yes stop_codon:yes gene_type:complete